MEATSTLQSSNHTNPARLLLLLLALACAGVGVWTAANMVQGEKPEQVDITITNVIVDPEISHADTKHPEDAPRVRRCFAEKGSYMNFLVDKTIKKYLRVCLLDKGIIGFQIVKMIGGKWYEITAYIKSEITTLEQLRHYIDTAGYCRTKCWIE